jgi:cell division protein FtsI/penicillin-binding protein 2
MPAHDLRESEALCTLARITAVWLSFAVCLTLCDTARAQVPGKMKGVSSLQQAVAKAMAGQSGAAIVIDAASGKVLAAYHPEVAAQRVALPGSAIKPFTLLALLDGGKINDQTALMCGRPLTVGSHKLDCTHPELQQPLDPAMALAYSCNSYFTTVVTRLAPAELRNSLLKDGFGSPSGLAHDEAVGTVTLAGTQVELQLQAIGEWGVRVTPLQLLRGYQRLAALSQNGDPKLAPLFAGLAGSVSYGMGQLAQPDAPMKIAGKTGTSLVEEGPWRHGWFAGYAPAEKPRIALVVFLEQGHGPSDAANVARSIFAAYSANLRSGK